MIDKINNLVKALVGRFNREQNTIGIDIGTTSVKVAEVSFKGNQKTIVKSALVELPAIPAKPDQVVTTLKTALIGMDAGNAKVMVAVNCPRTCTRRIVAPHMPRKELNEAVRWEAKNAIPYSLEESSTDYGIIDEISEKGVQKHVIAVAAAPNETIQQTLSLLAELDVHPAAILPASLSLQNVMTAQTVDVQGAVAVVEMGASITELNIYHKGIIAFSRKLPVSGMDLTKSMTSMLMSAQGKIELTMSEAESIKKEKGIPASDDIEQIYGKIQASQVLSLIRPCVEQLSEEIERSFDFYREESHGGRVSKIVLFGGGAHLKGLVEFLRAELEVDVELGNCLTGMDVLPGAVNDPLAAASALHLAIGAALSDPQKINLLPVELKEKTKRLIENVSLKALLAGTVVTLLLVYLGMCVKLKGIETEMRALVLEKKALIHGLSDAQAQMLVGTIIIREPYWEDVFKEMSHLVPVNIYLIHFDMEEQMVTLKGEINHKMPDAPSDLSSFMLALENGIFRDVSLVSTRKKVDNMNASEFEITCVLE